MKICTCKALEGYEAAENEEGSKQICTELVVIKIYESFVFNHSLGFILQMIIHVFVIISTYSFFQATLSRVI